MKMMKFHLRLRFLRDIRWKNVLCTADGENLNTITEENGSYTFIMPGKNVTITVNVRPIQYTINLDLQEGTGTTTTIYGSVENLPVLPNDNPEKQGYNFKGWFDAPTKRNCNYDG